jgi:hypothetical protein
MADYVYVFVRAEADLADFAKELEQLLGIDLRRESDDYGTWYEFINPRAAVTLGEHEFINDRDLKFEDYRYDIQVRALRIKTDDPNEPLRRRDEFARSVFEKLKATRKYPLMLVDNLQTKLEEFHPVRDRVH